MSLNPRRALNLMGLERFPAAARAHRVRIADREPGGLQRLDPVDLDTLEHRRALRVDEHLHAAELAHPVPRALGLGERHPVRITRTAALLNAQAQAHDGLRLLRQQLAQLPAGALGQRHHEVAPWMGRGWSPTAPCLDVSAIRAMPATVHTSPEACSSTR